METSPPPATLYPPPPHPHPPDLPASSRPDPVAQSVARSVARSGVPVERRPAVKTRTVTGRRSLPAGCLPLAALTLAAGCGPGAPAPPSLPAAPVLESLEVAGPAGPKPLVPAFAPDLHHYAVRCDERETLTVAARPAEGKAVGNPAASASEPPEITLNGAPLPAEGGEVSLRDDQDLAVEVRRGAGATTYAVHCVPHDFPEVTVVTRDPGPAEGLLLVDTSYVYSHSFLAVLDDHGVPRFHRRVEERAFNFRWHAAHRLYSYANRLPDESCSYNEYEIVLLDERLEVADRVRAPGLCNTDFHEFTITDEGNYLFLSYLPAERDFSAVPDREGGYSYGKAEPTFDSVISEVTPEGEVVFRWNSGEARGDGTGPPLKLADCRFNRRFPRRYAWLNSFSLTSEGNLLASFRGCAQVLEIERPSGRVLRQIGGRAPALPDGRVHHRFVGDPYPAGFCGQHSPIETGREANGDLRLALFDNGILCFGDWPQPYENHRTRVVEYRLSDGEAVFLRHYESLFSMHIAGSVQALENGNWLISQGWNQKGDRRPQSLMEDHSRPATSVVEVDPLGREVFAMWVAGTERAWIYRAYREPGLTIPLNLP